MRGRRWQAIEHLHRFEEGKGSVNEAAGTVNNQGRDQKRKRKTKMREERERTCLEEVTYPEELDYSWSSRNFVD